MMARCELCRDEFYKRWRNDPNVCVGCAVGTRLTVCASCSRVESVGVDPLQLDAFGGDSFRVTAIRSLAIGAATLANFYAPPPRTPPRSVQLRNPFF